MAIDETILARARKGNRPAIETIFAENYPAVCRIALGLTGRVDVGTGVTRFVLKRAMIALAAWKTPDTPQRWFLHHTILTTRRAAKHQPGKLNDTLIADPKNARPEYVAFIRALRSLPMQQREAFILYHAERLNERFSAVAMDCSVIAASNHLNAATATLRPIAGNDFGLFIEEIIRVYRGLNCTESLPLPKVRRIIVRHIWAKRLARLGGWLVIILVLLGAGWFVWKIGPMLRF